MSEQNPQSAPDPTPGGPTERAGKPASTPPPSEKPPRAVSARLLVGVALIVIVSVGIGVKFGGPIGGSARGFMGFLGFGHDHNEDAQAAEGEDGIQYYTCGMHPWIILPNPGNCPICQMTLTPLDPSKFSGEVTIDPLSIQNIGVRIGEVVTGPLVKTIRTVGTVDYNEPMVRDINIKVNGWIEKLTVDYLGSLVTKGQGLFDLYSPELYSAQEEYLLAYRNLDKVGADFVPDAARGAASLLEAARTRLLYYDITPEQVRELEQTGTPAKTMTIRSPYEGVVIAKHANEGMKVDPGMQVYRIADLSKVWVMVTLYEYQLPYVQAGQDAVMTLPYIPGQRFEGKIIYIYPYLDKKTREVQVRLEFDNANGLLKPGMFANIELQNTLARERTLAPREAIIDTGERQVAFVSLGEGKFEPRDVLLGIENGDGMVEVLSGLEPGESVVTSGQFLIDSEANLRESLAKMVRGDTPADQKPQAPPADESQVASLPGPASEAITGVMDAYLKIGDGLASDSTQNVEASAQRVADGLTALMGIVVPGAPDFWHKHGDAGKALTQAIKLRDAGGLEEARLRFADLSIALGSLLKATGVPQTYPRELQELHCPMYRQGQGGSIWLQAAGDVRNPFLGTAMPTCFDKRTTLPITGGAATQPDAPPTSSTDPPDAPAQANLSPQAQQGLDTIVASYLSIHALLAEDKFDGVQAHLTQIHQTASTLTAENANGLAGSAARVASQADAEPADLVAIRDLFDDLTGAVAELTKLAPPTEAASPGLYLVYCPMVKKSWLQPDETIRNPYASSMSGCGTIKTQFPLRGGPSNAL